MENHELGPGTRFEFSQAHLFFWHKVESVYYILNKLVELYKEGHSEGEALESMTMKAMEVISLFDNPVCDGGSWHMFANLVEKFGVMPKGCYPDSFSTKRSRNMNELLESKVKEFCCELLLAMAENKSDGQVQELIKKQTQTIFK